MNAFSISLPATLEGNTINCTAKRPTIGTVKRFRQLRRQTLDQTYAYNAQLERFGEVAKQLATADPADDNTALKKLHDDLEKALEALDADQYSSLCDQVTAVLTIFNVTTAEGATPLASPTFDAVDWESVETTDLQKVISFFDKSITG